MIPFTRPTLTGNEAKYLMSSIELGKFSGHGTYTKKCEEVLTATTSMKGAFLTPSCTDALEMSALLLDLQPGDEVIMPSYTFVSTANAFVLRGCKIVFVDIRPDTMNIDETQIEPAITQKTKAIVLVHYAGVGCEMAKILQVAKKYNIPIIEDAAQCMGAYYQGKPLGGFGRFSCFSFHETKNLHCGEGGALLTQDPHDNERAYITYEKGTNRTKFIQGQVDKYTWVDKGSSFLMSELQAAFLFAQLENLATITRQRLYLWQSYFEILSLLAKQGDIELPTIPPHCSHNGHIFFLKTENQQIRDSLLEFLKHNQIQSTFHYVPLHSSPGGLKYGCFHGEDKFTTCESARLLRLPLFDTLSKDDVEKICEAISSFFTNK